MPIPRFDWDPQKAESNRRKHGVSFTEAASAFADRAAMTGYDSEHSFDEDREHLVGVSSQGRLLHVSFTYRSGLFRIISARKASKRERLIYEESRS